MKATRTIAQLVGALIVGLLAATAFAQTPAAPPSTAVGPYNPVTDARLLDPEPENWLMYKGNYSMWGYSPLDSITSDNVTDLVPVWTFSTGQTSGHEAPPIVNDGVMFVTGAYNTLFALNAVTGDPLWTYKRDLPQDVYTVVCCDVVNRGVALYGNDVYMATLDSHLLAFDATTGDMLWDTMVADYTEGYAMTIAPLAVEGKIMVGVSGGEYGIRGFVAAYDAQTGDELWKAYTTAAPDQPGGDTWPGDTAQHGAASVWVTASYDPETHISYWGTSNAGPWMGQVRPGDNLYASSVVGIDVNDGTIKTHYQYNPNETWDYDEISDQTLVTVTRDGQEVKGLIHAGRNGYFYLLGRDEGNLSFIYGEPYMDTASVISGFEADGRPIVPADQRPGINTSASVCPSTAGGNNWFGTGFNPDTGYAYVPTTEWCMTITGQQVVYNAGQRYIGAQTVSFAPEGRTTYGALQAIDVATGKVMWRDEQPLPVRSALMSTSGNLVFIGDVGSREFRAFDATTGEKLWSFKTNSGVIGVPTSFAVDGVQYIAVQSGIRSVSYVVAPAAKQLGIPYTPAQGGVVWVFALRPHTAAAQ